MPARISATLCFQKIARQAWETREELHALVDRLDEVADKRRRYLDLAQRLAAGTVSHRRERTRQERMAQRDAAVAELMEISALTAPPDLPGPAAEEWLNWACGLEDGSDDDELQNLKTNFPRVDDFVRQLEIELWHDGPRRKPRKNSCMMSSPTSLCRQALRPRPLRRPVRMNRLRAATSPMTRSSRRIVVNFRIDVHGGSDCR